MKSRENTVSERKEEQDIIVNLEALDRNRKERK